MYRILILLLALFLDFGRYSRRNYAFEDSILYKKIAKRNKRINALKTARAYLKPYKKIFGDFCLSNKFCMVNYISGNKIFAMSNVADETGKKSICTAENFAAFEIDDFWDNICLEFNHRTHYHEVLHLCRLSALDIQESFMQTGVAKNNKIQEKIIKSAELIDVNNCSEAELTALPGISAVISKKIIKFREETRPFKSVKDFINEMKIKPHFANQLENMICVKSVNMRKVKKAQQERIIDI